VLARQYGISGFPGKKSVEAKLWKLAESLLPSKDIGIYTQALMDLGATVCTKLKPDCSACPVRRSCVARKKGRVEDIPAPRPMKTLPTKRTTWLLLLHKGSILLERRPSTGLWGGLWTFPEAASKKIEAECRLAYGCDIASTKKLKILEHGFSHFNLRIQPLACEVRSTSPRAEESGRMWIEIEDAKGAAVPAPVRKLLERIS